MRDLTSFLLAFSDLSYATQSAAKRLESHQDDERYRSVLEWLSTTDSLAHQNDILKGRQEATGQWFLDDPKFQLWLNGEAATLFCHGIPGAGKTMMTSIIIDNLQSRFDPHPEVGILFFYFNYKRPAEQTIENLMASLLKQVLQKSLRYQPKWKHSIDFIMRRDLDPLSPSYRIF